MKGTNKVLSALLVLTMILSLLLMGCGGGEKPGSTDKGQEDVPGTDSKPGEEKEDTGDSGERAKVTLWTLDADDFNRGMEKCFKLIEDEIDLNVTRIPDTQYENKLKVAISADNSPDVISIDSPTLAAYVEKDVLEPLDDFWDEEDREDLVNASKEAFTYKGKIWAAPFNETNCVVYYNKDMFDEVGLVAPEKLEDAWTWEEFRDAAIKLTKKDDSGNVEVYGILPLMAGPDMAHEGQNYVSNTWTWQAGADIISPDGTTTEGYFNSEKSLKALTYFGEFFTKYNAAPLQEIPNGFQTGKIAMWITGPWMVSTFETIEGLNWGAMPLPKDEKQISNSGGWSFGMSSSAENKEAAFKAIMSIGGKEGMREWCKETKNLPARKSLFDDPELNFLQEGIYPMILEQLEKTAKARPVTPAYPVIAQALQKCFNDVAYGKDPAEAMTEYSKMIEEGLKKVESGGN